jgi:hypothetical protein
MNLNARAVFLATGFVSALSYVFCALMVAVRPEGRRGCSATCFTST